MTQTIIVLLLVCGVLLLAQWLLFGWWIRSVVAALVALFVASALASPADAFSPIKDAVTHLLQPRGQATVAHGLTIVASTTAIVLLLGVAVAVKGRIADAALESDDYYFLSEADFARYTPVARPDMLGASLPGVPLGVNWSREVLVRGDRSPVWGLVSVAGSALGAVAAYYALVAGLIAAYERRGLSHAPALVATNHTHILFWIFLVVAIGAAIWAARREVVIVHVVSITCGDHDYVLSTWRGGIGRAAVELYTHPTPQGAQPVAPADARVDGNAPALAETSSIDMAARPGWTCRGLLIAPPPAGWPPDRQSPSYTAECAAWYARMVSCVDQGHFAPLPTSADVPGAPTDTNRVEREMRKALQHDGIPADVDCGVAWAAQPTRGGDYYWPDAAVRVQADLLLVDMETDGRDHTRPGRTESDKRRDAFFISHGWYTARLWMKSADPTHWQRDLVRDLRRLMRGHQAACQAARRTSGASMR